MNGYRIFIGAMLIAIGVIVSGVGAFTVASTPFTDSYPTQSDWFNDGNLDNLNNDQGTLVIQDLTNGSGTFQSNIFKRDSKIQIERISFDTSNIAPNQDRVINITVQGRINGAVLNEKTVTVTESGTRTVQEILPNGDQFYDSYSFEATLYTGGQSSPELNSLTVYGNTQEGGDLMSKAIALLLMGVGLLIVAGEF